MLETKNILWPHLFAIEIPCSWSWTEADGVISLFFEKDGVGAIQISFARRTQAGDPTESEARELADSFANQRGWELGKDSVRTTEIAGCPASEFEFTEQDHERSFWYVWHIVGSQRAAFLTYTCDPRDAKLEETERNAIVRSFSWL